ncbi:MAG: triple tyrosine motif-containing protein, partial [Clostridium sp.]
MSEVLISFDKNNVGVIEDEINIKAIVENQESENLQYKFIEGLDGIWNPIQDFSSNNICVWKPKMKGKHIIMVQVKDKSSNKPFDHLGKGEFVVNSEQEEKKIDSKIIEDVILDKTCFNIGEKINIRIKSNYELALYRFWIKGKQGWEPLRDYSTEKNIVYTANSVGNIEILIEGKMPKSENNVDEFTTIRL